MQLLEIRPQSNVAELPYVVVEKRETAFGTWIWTVTAEEGFIGTVQQMGVLYMALSPASYVTESFVEPDTAIRFLIRTWQRWKNTCPFQ